MSKAKIISKENVSTDKYRNFWHVRFSDGKTEWSGYMGDNGLWRRRQRMDKPKCPYLGKGDCGDQKLEAELASKAGGLLTDEEICAIIAPYRGKLIEEDKKKPLFTLEKEVAKAQAALTARQMIEMIEKELADGWIDGKAVHFDMLRWESLKSRYAIK